MTAILFEDVFRIKDIDPEGKKFDRVSRIVCVGEYYEVDLTLDINIELFPVEVNQRFTIALASTLNLDGTPDDATFDQSDRKTLADDYDYVMYGKVYKYSAEKNQKVAVYASYGGLLMMMKGDPRHLQSIEPDMRLYLLMKHQ